MTHKRIILSKLFFYESLIYFLNLFYLLIYSQNENVIIYFMYFSFTLPMKTPGRSPNLMLTSTEKKRTKKPQINKCAQNEVNGEYIHKLYI